MAAFTYFNILPEIAERFPESISKIVRATAFQIQAQAQMTCPVQTGNLKNSIYTKTDKDNQYPGNADHDIIDDQVPPAELGTAYVAVAASYGIYVEMGVHGRPGKPYLAPAVATIQAQFDQIASKLEEYLTGLGGDE